MKLRTVWRQLPFPIQTKQRIRSVVFSAFPFLFRGHPAFPGWQATRRSKRNSPLTQAEYWASPVPLTDLPPPKVVPVRVLAFYLPQFHPIPENDEWWGRGFTEWRNVVRGQPRFIGHYQPHLPSELGFYDLRVPEVQARQVELARLYGVSGFVFYFYWFQGRRLLERPILQYLEDRSLDLPFCLCWANESWTRRWDGRDRDLLIAQAHSPSDDMDFIAYIASYLRDERYIRVDGRPVLLVYRPDLMPDATATAKRWRSWCREAGIGEIYLAYTQSFSSVDPASYGFDAAVEFPPNNTNPQDITAEIALSDPNFAGVIFDWRIYPRLSREYRDPGYRLFRGVNPGWDNDARRPGTGAIFYGSSPAAYREWLENAIKDTVERFSNPDERLVFVNAWNEWAEGAHLEPDQRYGYAYLQATRDALGAMQLRRRREILVVAHDARPHGAQLLSLNICRELSRGLGYRVHLLVLGDGPLLADYALHADVRVLDLNTAAGSVIDAYVEDLKANGVRDAIVNSTASAPCIPYLRSAGIRVTVLVHELPELIRNHRLQRHARLVADLADHVVFPAEQVRQAFNNFGRLEEERIRVRPQGLYKRNQFTASRRAEARGELRRRLGLASSSEIVVAVGYGDHRKGFDLFVEMGLLLSDRNPAAVLIWVGLIDASLEIEALRSIEAADRLERFFLVGHESDTDLFYAGADVYAMTSREDPFPSVVLEALEAGVPVLGFAGAGGFARLARTGCVELVPAFDVAAYAERIAALLADKDHRSRVGTRARELVNQEFGFRRYLVDLLELSSDPLMKVSVVVPNYNYLAHLPARLATIVGQTLPIYELIILDDASTDGSQTWIEINVPRLFPDAQIVFNQRNSGSVFEQWLRGVSRATGDYVWIAEADDLAEPSFLAEVLAGFSDPKVVLSFAQSKQIDEDGTVGAEDYLAYVSDISQTKWLSHYVNEGEDEIRNCLAIKNTIPNVSGVVFRRDVLSDVLHSRIEEIRSYRNAGDWLVYAEVLRCGRIAFTPSAVNLHRRHRRSVTIAGFGRDQLREILAMQRRIQRTFSVEPKTTALATEYANLLFREFGLATEDTPSIEMDPAFADLMAPGQ